MAYSPDLPLWTLPELDTTGGMVNRAHWNRVSLTALGQLFDTEGVLTFGVLQEQHRLSSGQFLTHEAILAAVRKTWGHSDSEPTMDPTLLTILTWSSKCHRATNIYRALTQTLTPPLPTL